MTDDELKQLVASLAIAQQETSEQQEQIAEEDEQRRKEITLQIE